MNTLLLQKVFILEKNSSMQLTFKGNTAIVTGACGGMGLEISNILSKNNISVLMLDLQRPPKNFLSKNKNCQFKKIDVTNFKKLKSIVY